MDVFTKVLVLSDQNYKNYNKGDWYQKKYQKKKQENKNLKKILQKIKNKRKLKKNVQEVERIREKKVRRRVVKKRKKEVSQGNTTASKNFI